MALDPESKARFNLSKATILLMDVNPLGMSVLTQTVTGLGATRLLRCNSPVEARDKIMQESVHLTIVDAGPYGEGYDYIAWLRRNAPDPNCFAPSLLVAAHTRAMDVARARDCGANFILRRPLSPRALLERTIWIVREDRTFVQGPNYAGPDRRFRSEPPPPGKGRRWQDPPVTEELDDRASKEQLE